RCKEELIAVARDLGLEDEGRVEDLRKSLSSFIQGGNYSAETKGRMLEWEARFTKEPGFSLGGPATSMGGRAYQKSEPDLRKAQERDLLSTASLKLSVPTSSGAAGSRRDERPREFCLADESKVLAPAPKADRQVPTVARKALLGASPSKLENGV
ncbi:hypothetical protein AWZ03_015075, partial [Drosophila navojoa]